MEEKLTKQQVQKMIEDALYEFQNDSHKWQKVSYASDQYTPLSPASPQVAFYGSALVTKQTVTGSRGANAALASLLTALSNLGLITNNSS